MEICLLTLDMFLQQKPDKSKKKWFQKEEESVDVISFSEQSPLDVPAQPPTIEDDVKQTESDNEQIELAHLEAEEDAEPAVAEAQPAVEVESPPSIISCQPEISEETAATMIQTAFRGYTVLLYPFTLKYKILTRFETSVTVVNDTNMNLSCSFFPPLNLVFLLLDIGKHR